MSYSSKLVSALVLNYRSPRDTIRCVEALRAQTVASQLEIVIIDNHSDDESIGWIRARYQNTASVRIIEERNNTGYGCGNNAGLTFVESEFLLIINPDNTMPRDALEHMLLSLRSRTDIGVVGPALVHPDGSIRASARQFPTMIDLLKKRLSPDAWQKHYAEWTKTIGDKDAVEVDWLVGACLLMRTELFRSLGGFDPRFFLFFEDIDLCRRIHLLGKKVLYLPRVRVLDRKRRLSGSSMFSLLRRKTTWIHFASGLKYFWKWRGTGLTAPQTLSTVSRL